MRKIILIILNLKNYIYYLNVYISIFKSRIYYFLNGLLYYITRCFLFTSWGTLLLIPLYLCLTYLTIKQNVQINHSYFIKWSSVLASAYNAHFLNIISMPRNAKLIVSRRIKLYFYSLSHSGTKASVLVKHTLHTLSFHKLWWCVDCYKSRETTTLRFMLKKILCVNKRWRRTTTEKPHTQLFSDNMTHIP